MSMTAQGPDSPVSSQGAVSFGQGTVTAAAVENADPLALMAAVARLGPTGIEQLCEAEAEAFVIACERVVGAVHARQSLAMDTLAGRVEQRLEQQQREQPRLLGVPGPDVHGTVASMLSPALHCSTRAVARRLEADRWLVCAAESTFSSHWQGDLERFRADVVAETSIDVAPALRETFEALVLETTLDEVTGELTLVSPAVRQLSRAELARRARAIAAELDPDSPQRAVVRARGERRVVVTPDRRRPGMSRWHVLLPTEVSHEVFAAVDAVAAQYARAHPGTPIDSHRADALADLVLGNAEVRTTVELVIPVLAAAGGADDGDRADDLALAAPAGAVKELNPLTADLRGSDPLSWLLPGSVELPRHGELVPAAIAEILSRPETLVRLARLDSDGSIVQDPKTYRPSASLRRRLRTRDGTCRFPGCQTPANRCDLDHVIPFPAGPTEAANLISLCRTHHRFKHHGGWRAELRDDATVAWTAPDGRAHVSRPRPVRITHALDLTAQVDAELVHQLRRGWRPGLPVGMSLDELVAQESTLPEDAPEPGPRQRQSPLEHHYTTLVGLAA